MASPHDTSVPGTPATVRNVAIVGRSGIGKTALVMALRELDADGTGNTASTAMTTTNAVTSMTFGDTTINVIDTPGHADFAGLAAMGIHASDAVLFVIAAHGGIDYATSQMWQECAQTNKPRAVAITQLDHENADFDETIALCQRVLDENVHALCLPLHGDNEGGISGLMNLLTSEILDYSDSFPPAITQPEQVHLDGTADNRTELVEKLLTESDDETLLTRYIDGETIDEDVLLWDLGTAVTRGTFHPAIPVKISPAVGIDTIIELIVNTFPAPEDTGCPTTWTIDGDSIPPLSADPSGPLLCSVIGPVTLPKDTQATLVRVYSGTLTAETTINISRKSPESDPVTICDRIGAIYTLDSTRLHPARHCTAGDICLITTRVPLRMGDTISNTSPALHIDTPRAGRPDLPTAISIPNNGTLQQWQQLALEHAATFDYDPDLRQHVLWCTGDIQTQLILDEAANRDLPINIQPVGTAYRGTILDATSNSNSPTSHRVSCQVTITPTSAGNGIDTIVDQPGLDPTQTTWITEAVDEALRDETSYEYPITDVSVAFTGVSHHPEANRDDFVHAVATAINDATRNSRIQLLEPIESVTIIVPAGYVSTVTNDITARRGVVVTTRRDDDGHTIIDADIPTCALKRYPVELREMTAGSSTYHHAFSHYQPAPDDS